ncbi:TetR/AcrR family transcriptional regulator [Xenorhabdus szentirmaii]|uniref:Transcriptional regulator, TetR family n=2 Tax=Xenorhabdus szentirmaii TaxID=290112 RepID=W1IY12_9GAMM|nr:MULTISPECIES: TetR/AcrR family transcriptional regulator [Xenorhabdus]MBD2779566.1 TetR/AcrR family transcriptional regulator [Xenorhabdus sp. 38]MBD2790908.1 TetR/AcrR family transcriptional regulator [Xenorhabdus sp. CUL]MBD2801281.1 TetR/AcrR family transcriptional regulator [Xenorhabdus sp. M]MBD2803944.1 TetR/AcrR family transcriptional regulator [Xenorhabdus sp. ZM]MBD2820268.1 TetR/AcrR family transcriptional regulator [Xenorhabdus sp. 42]
MAENHPRPRGRPTIPEQETRRKIHNITFSLLINQGYSKTTMDVVAQKAGIAKKTLYRFVKNREDLIEQIFLSWEDKFIPAFQNEGNNPDQLINLLKIYLNEIAKNLLSFESIGLFKLLQSDFPHREILLTKYQQGGIERSKIILTDWLNHQCQQGFLKKMDFNMTSELIISMVISEPLRQMSLGLIEPVPETNISPRIIAAITLLESQLGE